MDRTILQIPVSKVLKNEAEAVSMDFGFSSLQEFIRLILKKIAKRELTISIGEIEEISSLTPFAEKRFKKALEDIKKDRNIVKPKNSEEFLKLLRS